RQRKKRLAEYFRQAHGLTLPPETTAGFGPSAGGRKIILVTGHRRENFGSRFENIFLALREVAEKRRDVTIIYPVHLNPNVQRQVNAVLNGVANIRLIGPLDYDPFVFLMSRVHIVLTDSGGIQEEAPSLGRPVLVTRETTERPEGIEAGTVKLVGTDKDKIVREVLKLLEDPEYYNRISRAVNPYGDGKASERIVDALYSLFTGRFLKNQP
ncbi:MAG: UDP-N-acetylglucosamine 2-epimerase (non-hydrolyzing), partial [Deltaproteobacteria bacterium]|nr:UDP-N-acetylglucosamine 2-epimerase (non-hydrolyzing) [Deltaproteobacteria bacterium]